MNRRLPFRRILAVLGLLALLTAQMFGVVRGYQCDCTGRMEWTAQDHCHGPHHGDCHHDEAPGHQHEENNGAGERQDHQQVRDELEVRSLPAVAMPNFAPVLFAVFQEARVWSELVAPPAPRVNWDVGTGPLPGVAVARTTVLLI